MNLGFGGKTLRLIMSLYQNDNIKFIVNGKYTAPIWLTLGVKQGIIIRKEKIGVNYNPFRL